MSYSRRGFPHHVNLIENTILNVLFSLNCKILKHEGPGGGQSVYLLAYELRSFPPYREVCLAHSSKGLHYPCHYTCPREIRKHCPKLLCYNILFILCSLMYLCVSLTLAHLLQMPSNLNFKGMSVLISS